MVFGTLPMDLLALNKRLARYVKAGKYEMAMQLFRQMRREGINPNVFTFVPVLNACSNLRALEEGRSIHANIIKGGYEADVYVGSCLVNMYAKCRSIDDARTVFDRMPTPDVVAWTGMILGYVKCGEGHKALELSQHMQWNGVAPDSVTFVGVLNACANVAALEEGRCIHEQITKRGLESDVFVGNSLIDMYSKCGSIDDAWRVFNKMATRDVVTWNTMILGYVKSGQGQKALELYQHMTAERVEPDAVTFVGVVNGCASVAALEQGRCIHKQIIESCYESNVFVGNSLVDMYAKCGSIEDAWRVFNKMAKRDVVTWTSIILGYVKYGEGKKAFELFRQMVLEGVEPNPATFVGVMNACASVVALEEGRCLHTHIIQKGFSSNVYVGNSLIAMYAKCGSVQNAQRVFNKMPVRNLVTWNTMLRGYAMDMLRKQLNT